MNKYKRINYGDFSQQYYSKIVEEKFMRDATCCFYILQV